MDKINGADITTKPRFLVDELSKGVDAEILHFEPVSGGRDRFGNRVFSSELSYRDADRRDVKSALLVSRQGEDFIRQNPGILSDLDRGMNALVSEMKTMKFKFFGASKLEIDLAKNRHLSLLGGGNQSQVFVLEVSNKKFAIKTPVSLSAKYAMYSQPYINEMLQIQTIQESLGPELEKANVYLPEPFFASGHISCTNYVDGDTGIMDSKTRERVVGACDKVLNFVETKRRSGDPLWKNVDVDWIGGDRPPLINMIQRGEKIFWVDPVFHNESY